jgi:polyhydroxyalkanoate synthesis repressor PhaR
MGESRGKWCVAAKFYSGEITRLALFYSKVCCSAPNWITLDARQAMGEKIVLRKYPNRRIYDPEKSAYITLEQVCEIIRRGRQVTVIDARTKEDVTAFILSQIIVEEAKNKNILLPVSFLHLVIQHGSVLAEFFEKYLELTLKNYLLYKSTLDEQFKRWLDVGKNFSSVAQKTLPATTPWDSMFDLFLKQAKKTEKKDL